MHGWVSVENDLGREVLTQEAISEQADGNNPGTSQSVRDAEGGSYA